MVQRQRLVYCILHGWPVLVCGALIGSVLALVTSDWTIVTVSSNSSDVNRRLVNIGPWRVCHDPSLSGNSSTVSSNAEMVCSSLNQTAVSGWFRAVQVMSICSVGTGCLGALGLFVLFTFGDMWSRSLRILTVLPSIMLLILVTAFAELASVLLHGIYSSRSLPVCVTWCPSHMQPLPSCDALNLTAREIKGVVRSCDVTFGPGYYTAVVSDGLALLATIVGLCLLCTTRSTCCRGDDVIESRDDVDILTSSVDIVDQRFGYFRINGSRRQTIT